MPARTSPEASRRSENACGPTGGRSSIRNSVPSMVAARSRHGSTTGGPRPLADAALDDEAREAAIGFADVAVALHVRAEGGPTYTSDEVEQMITRKAS